jgi:hypothetical protein
MNVEAIRVCILPAKLPAWDQIDWSKWERTVRRLQARIVRATQGGPYGGQR